MQEIKAIIAKYDILKSSNLKMALAIVVNVEQSSYRRSGARMLITEDGQWVGGISGGCLEGDTLQKAKRAIFNNTSLKVTYDTRVDDPNQIGVGLGCNGLIDILIIPIRLGSEDNPIELLRKIVARRISSVLMTHMETGATTDVTQQNNHEIDLGNEISAVWNNQKSKLINGHFIEYIPPSIALYIFGKNYDVVPLAQICKAIGWEVNIVANPTKITKELNQCLDKLISDKNIDIKFDDYSVALLMSHDYTTDLNNLILLQKSNLKYIGLLGPKKRKEKMINDIYKLGISINEQNLFGPIGLDTGAITPEEIAISMIAEIRTIFSNRDACHLRLREGSIH